jgi:hypothetical protein
MRRFSRSQKCCSSLTKCIMLLRFCKQPHVNSKKKPPEGGLYCISGELFLLIELRVARLELVNTTGCIHQLHLTGEERMRCV